MENEQRWSAEHANNWYAAQPWLVGCNYIPRTAINQLEMWQAETFDPTTIREELSWAAGIGMNCARVYLHDLAWRGDPSGFKQRVREFLQIASNLGIKTFLVFFDSCWYPFPYAGKQRDPEPGVHNSFWVQSPGVPVLRDEKRFDALREYVVDVVGSLRDDPRVLAWDLWNEPDNNNWASRGCRDLGDQKAAIAARLLPRVFDWARSARPSQPLTSAIWLGDWCCDSSLKHHERIQLENSDVISFHCYGQPDQMAAKVAQLQRFGRPLICSEYMSRGTGSTFEAILPILKQHRVAAFNWGLVAGRTQTHFPWDSWQNPYPPEPPLWFHEVFRDDGKPYREVEAQLIARLTGAEQRVGV